jgi:dipeptidyl-peptidase-4
MGRMMLVRATGALAVVCALAPGAPAEAQRAATPKGRQALTYEQAFGGLGFGREAPASGVLAEVPTIGEWLDAGHYLETRRQADGRRRTVVVAAADGTSKPLAALEPGALVAPDGSFRIVSRADDLFRIGADGSERRLTATPAEETHPRLSPTGSHVAYVRDNDLFVLELASGLERQLTSDGSETILNGTPSWIYMEEILGRGSNAFWWSPDGSRIAFMRFDDSPVPIFPIYHADGQHGTLERTRYPKAGDPNPYVRIGVVAIADGRTRWLDFDEKADQYIAFPRWSADSQTVYVQWMNRAQDTLRVLACPIATGKPSLLHEEKQAAWVEFYEDFTALKDGSVVFTSDVDGWRHLYRYKADGTLAARLTSGAWRVQQLLRVAEPEGWVYFTGRPTKSWDVQVMRVKLAGGEPEILTREPGVHRAAVSPDGGFFVDTASTLTTPTRITLRKGDGTVVREIGNAAASAAFESIAWGQAELFTIPSADGKYQLPAYWVKPPDFSPAKKYPVIFTIYGGPEAGTVQNAWPSLAAHYWAERGVITISVDHRGGGAFGKAGVALMHRNLGKWEMTDLMAAAAWLRTRPFVAADRIGIAGSSYGGYTTAMALTYGAGSFNYGIAGSSVTDWALYDSVYTERYMDTPAENPDGYKAGAVLTYVDRYTGGLRITHGTIDDNVHMQNSVQVIDWLTSHDKRFELMIYPDSRHGIQASQRAHLNREAHDFWVRNLLGGKLPDVVVGIQTMTPAKANRKPREKDAPKERERTP